MPQTHIADKIALDDPPGWFVGLLIGLLTAGFAVISFGIGGIHLAVATSTVGLFMAISEAR